MLDFNGQVVLITGAGSPKGIGRTIAHTFARQGAQVVITDINQAGLDANVQEMEANGWKACGIAGNICDKESVDALVKTVVDKFGRIDVLVNNAGVAPNVRADLLDMSEESFLRVLSINLEGPFFLTQLAAKKILENRNGKFHCIINIGSVSADYASINRGEYCLSKAGMAMATKLWAVRLADENIPVYELRPGVIKSDMTSVVSAKYDKMIAEGLTLQRRWGMPEDIGKAVAMLVEGALAYSTGQVINIDGGLTIERF